MAKQFIDFAYLYLRNASIKSAHAPTQNICILKHLIIFLYCTTSVVLITHIMRVIKKTFATEKYHHHENIPI